MNRHIAVLNLLILLLAPLTARSQADEGMWLFNALPKSQLKSQYDFEPHPDWAQHVMLSSVRFNSGGSASFVSKNGLVLTNHHVAADTLHKLSTPEANYIDQGFLASSREQEIKAPDLELNQLVSIEDVTARVNAAVGDDLSAADAFKARRAAMADIEKESLDKSGLRSDVVTLFGGAQYHLYRYKKYTDVRLVWAPETKAAFFGGDPDNFEYPRYCLDVALFRVYEDGQPAQIEHYLKFSADGAKENELVFVSGNPGRTQRIFTTAAFKYLRDHRMPYVLDILRRSEILLQQYSYGGKEQERRARDELFGIQNSRKAYTGMLQGLQNPAFIEQKERQEGDLLAKLGSNAEFQEHAQAWDEIAKVQEEKVALVGQFSSFRSRLYRLAERLVLMAAEDQKPSPARLREFRESARESLQQQLFSPAPIYDDLEVVQLGDELARLVERRGGDHPLVGQVLAGKSPQARAVELVRDTKLKDVDVRKAIAKGGMDAIQTSSDPLILLARTMEPELRRLREISDELDERERQAYASITAATNAMQGTSSYPDATFTLRLAFGTVKGYSEDGQVRKPWTTMGGAFAHEQAHGAEKDWVLPDSWKQHRDKIDASTPLNFVCTADIIGGNSGSPVINRQAELVGVIFDGNIQSLTSDYMYSDEVARAISVHSSSILEALRNIYGAPSLAAD